MVTGRIYCITNQINGKSYIGKTMLSIEKRFQEHLHDAKSASKENRPLYAAINKYGSDNFTIELIEEVEYSILSEREQYWIAEKGTYENGYNATRGGDGSILYDYEEIVKKYQQGMLLKEIAEFYHCDKGTVSRIIKNAGENPVENQYNKLGKKVIAHFDDGTTKTFSSCSEAGRWLQDQGLTSAKKLSGISTNVSRAAKGERKSYLGILWEEL